MLNVIIKVAISIVMVSHRIERTILIISFYFSDNKNRMTRAYSLAGA
jgi:hypothetical protein